MLGDDGDFTPTDYPVFELDFDKTAAERYTELFTYFKEPLLEMEDYWYNDWFPDYYKDWFRDNLDALKVA